MPMIYMLLLPTIQFANQDTILRKEKGSDYEEKDIRKQKGETEWYNFLRLNLYCTRFFSYKDASFRWLTMIVYRNKHRKLDGCAFKRGIDIGRSFLQGMTHECNTLFG